MNTKNCRKITFQDANSMRKTYGIVLLKLRKRNLVEIQFLQIRIIKLNFQKYRCAILFVGLNGRFVFKTDFLFFINSSVT